MNTARQHLLLSQIVSISPLNPRANLPPDAQIAALAASLKATGGPVQPIVVRRLDGHDEFEVLIGRRRYLALQMLCPAGDITVAVDVFEGNDAEADLHSLAEQSQREPLHPAEEVRAFADLARQGFAPGEIARDFGCDERVVRQRLALGTLAPQILGAWRDGSLTREGAEAFTASPDQVKQVELFDHAPHLRRNPVEIRRRLRGDAIRADHGMAKFVGLNAYRAAGGGIDEDLFANDAWLTDGGKLRDLADSKLNKLGEALLKREGWGWFRTEFGTSPRARWRRAEDCRADVTDGEVKRLDEIAAELETLAADHPDAIALAHEYDALEAKGWTRGVKSARRKKARRLAHHFVIRRTRHRARAGTGARRGRARRRGRGGRGQEPHAEGAEAIAGDDGGEQCVRRRDAERICQHPLGRARRRLRGDGGGPCLRLLGKPDRPRGQQGAARRDQRSAAPRAARPRLRPGAGACAAGLARRDQRLPVEHSRLFDARQWRRCERPCRFDAGGAAQQSAGAVRDNAAAKLRSQQISQCAARQGARGFGRSATRLVAAGAERLGIIDAPGEAGEGEVAQQAAE
jgi:ParB/RepB/Spo0J family partition protein